MCYKKDKLQEIIDNAYEEDVNKALSHIDTCPDCKENFKSLKQEDKFIEDALNIGIIMPSPRPISHFNKNSESIRKVSNMNKQYKRWGAAAAAVAICGGLLFVDPIRAMADDILKMFRLQEIKSISVNESDFRELDRLFSEGSGSKDIKNIGKVEVSSEEKEISIENPSSTDEIKKTLGIDKAIELPDDLEYSHARKTPKLDVTMKLDINKTNDFLNYLGEKTKLPNELHQKPFVIHLSDVVGYSINDKNDKDKYMYISQMGTPTVEIPKDIDEKEVIKTLFSMNFLPQNLKSQFMEIDNLTSTIPVPYNPETQDKEDIKINGEKAILIKDKNSKYLSIYFKEKDTIYAINTNYSKDKIIPLIEEMK